MTSAVRAVLRNFTTFDMGSITPLAKTKDFYYSLLRRTIKDETFFNDDLPSNNTAQNQPKNS